MADIAAPAEFQFMKTKVVKAHHATDETQLELRLDDIVYVLEQDDSGWWGGHKEGEDCTGWFPGSNVLPLEEERDRLQGQVIETSSTMCPISMPSSASLPFDNGEVSLETEENNPINRVCTDGHELDAQSPLHRENRMVASPLRRVSDQRVSAGNVSPSIESATAVAILQLESRNANEQHTGEIQHLQDQLTEANEIATSARWRNEEMDRKCQRLEKEQGQLQTRVQELTTQLEARSSEKSSAERRAEALQEQLAKSQQESCDSKNECAQLRRRLQEKESELLKAKDPARPTQETIREPSLEELPQRRVVQGELPRASPPMRQTTNSSAESKTPTLGDDPRRRLFPSTADPSLAGMPPTENNLGHSILDATAEEVSNVSNTMETVPRFSERITAFNASRQPPQAPAGVRQAPVASAPRPGRSNSLTRPAFRASPRALSPTMAQSPGMARSATTPNLPDTPSRIDTGLEMPSVGSVKEMARLFEQRCGTPDRSRNEGSRPATDGDLSLLRGLASVRGQRSPVTEQRLRENPTSARSLPHQPVRSEEALPRVQNLTGLDMQEAEEDCPNFNMSPMNPGRNA